MRKRVLFVSLAVTLVGILLISLLFTDLFYKDTVRSAEKQLKIYMGFFDEKAVLGGQGAAQLSEKLGGARVTFLDEKGTVLDDSAEGALSQSLADREEVRAALGGSESYAVRVSETLGENMIYYCVPLEEPLSCSAGTICLVRIGMPLETEISVFSDAIPTILVFIALDILCCLLFTWLISGSVVKPVENFAKEAATLSGGEIKTKYPELEPLAKMMNHMSADLDEKAARMREDNRLEKLVLDSMEHGIVIFRDPEDVILINKTAEKLLGYDKNEPLDALTKDREIFDILEAKEAASVYRKIGGKDYLFRFTFGEDAVVLLITDVTESMSAARSKNEFIANVTHEMNTPLTSIRGFAELIEAGAAPPEKIADMAKNIRKQSDRLAKLIRRIINLSAIDSDELPDYEVDVSELVAECASTFEPRLREKEITFETQIDGGVKVLSRRERLTEILNNLISNGIRYNKQGGSLKVTLTGGEVPVLEVRDTGIGLSEEDKTRIFDRFYTVDKSHNGTGGGFGLGLAIVKKLCRRAGWGLTVESELGKGTAFVITFSRSEGQ
ncbi:MAG TPA: PAS domain-containing protein [Candidatus Borkfalkia excrementavium]|uniref:histidine kinase n=1 Tax=Candidatus Borkfalkia excrementavium TaxID=2838505 RepID=A0A9D1Z7K2_9FIRM|nr:PAS domain-containing protein [Candidatus Borkfalkia excrementavium]